MRVILSKKIMKSDFLLTLLRRTCIFFINRSQYFKEIYHATKKIGALQSILLLFLTFLTFILKPYFKQAGTWTPISFPQTLLHLLSQSFISLRNPLHSVSGPRAVSGLTKFQGPTPTPCSSTGASPC